MHPKALLDYACADLVAQVLKFDHPADAVVSRYFREHRSLGPRERATLAETAYAVLRRKLLFEHLARLRQRPARAAAGHPRLRRPARLPEERADRAGKGLARGLRRGRSRHLSERHRHNLPEWLAEPLKEQLGDEFWPLVDSLNQPAPLDLRVNALTDKREDVQKELKLAGIPAGPRRIRPGACAWTASPRSPSSTPSRAARSRCRTKARNCWPWSPMPARPDGGGLLRRRRRQDAGAGRGHAQHRAAVCLRRLRAPAGQPEAAAGAQQAVATCIRRPSPTSATSASSGWPARSTG
jgi:hypothetical protein